MCSAISRPRWHKRLVWSSVLPSMYRLYKQLYILDACIDGILGSHDLSKILPAVLDSLCKASLLT